MPLSDLIRSSDWVDNQGEDLMTENADDIMYADDIMCLTSGSLIHVQAWQDRLRAAGMKSRVVGDNLTAGLGTAIPGSVELWIHCADVEAAEAAMAGADAGGHNLATVGGCSDDLRV
jgi:hypothetical protein